MTKRHLLRRSFAAGVTLAVVTTALGVATGSAASADPGARKLPKISRDADVVKDSYIVVLKDKTASAATVQSTASTLTRLHGGVVKRTYSAALKGYAAEMNAAQAKQVAARPEVAYVEPNRRMRATGTPASWGQDRIDQTYLPLDNTYTAPNAGSGVNVYVIDTGIQKDNPEFGGRASWGQNFAPGLDGTTDPANANDCVGAPPDPIKGDPNPGHGTHVAGTIGGNNYGVAKGVNLIAVRVLDCYGSADVKTVLAGINWVTDHRQPGVPAVVNMSLGGGASTSINDAVARSIASGITYAVAAGNERFDACADSPASTPTAITVGATDKSDRRPSFSNFGRCVDVFAPGVGITSVLPTGTGTMSGTSMAAPHVAGAAAMLLSANKDLTPQQVRDKIVGGAVTGAVSNAGLASSNKLLQVGAAAAKPGTVLRLRAGANNLVVTAPGGGNSSLIASAITPGPAEEFEVIPSPDGFVGLRSHANGKYVTAEAGGAQPLIANRDAIGAWEKFTLTDNNGTITLKAAVNNKYVTAENAGSKALIANRDAAGAWETFTVAAPSTVVGLFSYAPMTWDASGEVVKNGTWVAAENGGNAPLIARTPYGSPGQWETFDLVDLGNGYVALRSYANGKYVTAENGGSKALIANRTAVGAWEMFKVVYSDGLPIALQANANGKYVTAEAAGAQPLIANRTAVGQWESFALLGM